MWYCGPVSESCWLFAAPWTAALSCAASQSLLRFLSIESVMPSNCLILHRPFLLLPSIFPSIRVFSNESALPIRWPKYRRFSISISPSNEHPGLISFRRDWLDLLASPRDSQESSPTPQFKSINSLALSLLHSPTLTSIHDHRKDSKRCMHCCVHSSTIHNNQDMETTWMVIIRWTDKEDMVHIYNRILLGHEKEWNNAICSNMDAFREYHTKLERERQIPYGNTCMWNIKYSKNDLI